jgi:ribosomal protein S18 acetylase RimI-like enzyme
VVRLEKADPGDIPAIVQLMNHAYRGGGAVAGWNSETGYIAGDRTNAAMIEADLAAHPEAHLLVWRGESGKGIVACAWLQPLDDARWYLGSLAMDPARQNGGLGRQMLAACEAWIAAHGGRLVRMTVVHVRDTLIAWYSRRGYRLTGETEPFPYDDDRFGVPQRADLHFVVLEKVIG